MSQATASSALAREVAAWGYAPDGQTAHKALIMRHPKAGVVKIYSSPRDPAMQRTRVLHKAAKQLAAIGIEVALPWRDTKPKTERKEATMPRGISTEAATEKERRLEQIVEYLTEHGPSKLAPLTEIAGVSEQSFWKQYGSRIPLARYHELVFQGGIIYALPNQPPPPNTRLMRTKKTARQVRAESSKPPVMVCGQISQSGQISGDGKPCIRVPGHWGEHRDNYGHTWDDSVVAVTKEEHAALHDPEGELVAQLVVKDEPTFGSDVEAYIAKKAELEGERKRLAATAQARLDELDSERAALREFLGVQDEQPRKKRKLRRATPRQDQIMALLADGKKRTYHQVAAELGVTPGSASSTLSQLHRDGRVQASGMRPNHYHREAK